MVVRGKNHHPPDPPRRPQVCAMAGRRLRLVRVNATELVGLEQTGRQFRACGSRAFPTVRRLHLTPSSGRRVSLLDAVYGAVPAAALWMTDDMDYPGAACLR
jgi:hypothetical protein